MSPRRMPESWDKFRRPEILVGEFLRKGVQSKFLERGENVPVLYRALVVAVDVEGGRLENPAGEGTVSHLIDNRAIETPATVGPSNPRNSLKARILSGGFDQFIHDNRLRVFWPFFPDHLAPPVKPGEHVYVAFEDPDFQHGLWFSKVSGHEGANFVRGESTYSREKTLKERFGIEEPSPVSLTDESAGESRKRDLRKKFEGG